MIVVSRFDVPLADQAGFLPRAQAALAAFAGRPGYVRGRIGRAADDPTQWVLTTEWAEEIIGATLVAPSIVFEDEFILGQKIGTLQIVPTVNDGLKLGLDRTANV